MFVHFITYETLIKVVSVAYYALETVALWAIRRLTRFGFDKLSRRYAGAHLSSPEIESVITIYASSSSNSLH